jgi:O-antigen ligase
MVATHFTHAELQQRNYALIGLGRGIEGLLWVMVLLFFSGAIIGLTFADAAALDSGENAWARMLWYPVYAAILALAVFRMPRTIQLAAYSPLIVLMVLWCGLTFLWSVDPGATLRRSIALLMTTFAGFAFAARFEWGEMIERIAAVMLVLCFIVFFVVVTNPMRGIMQEIHPGAWRGPWVEKNYLGGVMTKGLAAAICAFAVAPKRWWLWIPTGLFCFALVLLSTSKTSLLISLSLIGMFIVLRIFRRYPILRIPVVFAIVAGISAIVAFIIVDFEFALSLIGKDPTLTGRTDIWTLLTRAIEQRPWLGYGYGVFWLDQLGPSYETRTVLQWAVPTAHNGWFDAWLSGGAVVIALFLLLLVPTILISFARIKSGGVETYWVVMSLFFFIGFSLSESSILQQNDLSWFLFVATTAKLWAREPAWWRPGSRGPVAKFNVVR